tara:strand:- start:1439 stop:1870 length:432 start_codon:yes stop_codon:yes gene_type:complete
MSAKKAPAKRSVGRPSYVPTEEMRKQVELLSGIGVPLEQICVLAGIDRKTLSKHYRAEIDMGHAKANSRMAKRLFDIANSDSRDSLTACIFWLKCRAGWKPPADVEVNIDNSTKAMVINLPAEQEQALARVIEDAQHRVKRIP